MSNTSEVVMKINDCYVADDCVQIAYPYNECITILNTHGMLYHHKINSNFFVNEYLNDYRRTKFPFHNIPTFYAKNELGYLNCFTNQIFSYNKPYIIIKGNKIIENYVVKDGAEALIISKQLPTYKNTSVKTRKEVEEILEPATSIKSNVHNIYLNGSLPVEGIFNIDDEETIIQFAKENLKENLTDLREYIKKYPSSNVGEYLNKNPLFLNFIEKNLNTENVKNMDLNIPLLDDKMVITAKTNGNTIELEGLEITFVKNDKYIVDTYTIPVNQYTYEQIRFLAKEIINLGHPNIQLKHNPGVSKQDLESAKKMIYEKRKK